MKQHNGYTLIELLLVIAVLSVMASLAILTVRKNTDNRRIDQAALEMQHVLEAALAYRVDQDSWPPANNTLANGCTASSTVDTFINTYLPNGTYTSNYGAHFCWSSKTPGDKGPLFWVALKMPFSDATRNYQTATQIAARLPNALAVVNPAVSTRNSANTCTSGSTACYVRSEVVIPAASSEHDGNRVAGMGYCNPTQGGAQPGSSDDVSCTQGSSGDQYVIKFSCPDGEKGQVYTFANFYKAAALRQANPPTILTVLSTSTHRDTCHESPAGSSQYMCTISIIAEYDHNTYPVVHPRKGDAGTIGASYIAYCAQRPPQSTPVKLW